MKKRNVFIDVVILFLLVLSIWAFNHMLYVRFHETAHAQNCRLHGGEIKALHLTNFGFTGYTICHNFPAENEMDIRFLDTINEIFGYMFICFLVMMYLIVFVICFTIYITK